MKKTFAVILAMLTLTASAGLAQAEDPALTAAKAHVSEAAVLTETDSDDMFIEYEFSDKDAGVRYDVHVDKATNAVVRVETDHKRPAADASGEAMDEAAVLELAAQALPDATVNFSLLEKDDGRLEWNVFFTETDGLTVYTFDAYTGAVLDTEKFFSVPAGTLTADKAVEALKAAKGEVTLESLDLDLDDDTGKLDYDGEVRLDGQRYEFSLSAGDGSMTEWESEDDD